MKFLFSLLAAFFVFALSPATAQNSVFLETENFNQLGGWDIDQQFMEIMGSPYLLAHGMGVPVKDAKTTFKFPKAGKYRLWVRTKDWVAPWNAKGAPGKFQLILNGNPIPETFGTKGAQWHWHDGGIVTISENATHQSELVLRDLTGFEGRCDAIFFSNQLDFTPPNEAKSLEAFRRKALGLSATPEDGGRYDLVVVGGGLAGTAAALSAARQGLNVALVQDRPVLGGNASSEVRVWPEGHTKQKPFVHIGDIVGEIAPPPNPKIGKNAGHGDIYGDQARLQVVRAEPRITLLLEYRLIAASSQNQRISTITIQHIRSAKRQTLRAKFFADCTGDATLGFLVGADHEISHEGNMGASNLWNILDQGNQQQVLHCECKDKDVLSAAIAAGRLDSPFPSCPWAIDLSDKPFPGREQLRKGDLSGLNELGGWFWESGFDKDPIKDMENIRDLNLRAMYGAWDALKNTDKILPKHRLGWSAYIAGKRESRRLLGDVILTGDDFRQGKSFEDPAFPCSWHIDIHTPDQRYASGLKKDAFISTYTRGKEYSYQGPYWAPFRTLYSRNINNLFMAGRNISVNKEALGPVRVMRTTGMMGEIVGKAASIAVAHDCTPREIYQKHLPELKALMNLPGSYRKGSPNK